MNKIFTNSSGTTAKSYQFGKDGLVVYSEAATNQQSQQILKRYLKVRDPNGNRPDEKIAYISSLVIQSCQLNGNNTVTFTLNTGESFTINSTVNTGTVSGPASSKIGDVAIFSTTTGNAIKDSNSCITNTLENIDAIADALNNENGAVRSEIAQTVENSADLPTAMAVIDYVGTLSDALKRRLDGNL